MLTTIKNYLLVGSIIAFVVLLKLYSSTLEERKRLQGNQLVLLDSVLHYRVRDSLGGVSVGILRLKLDELERYREEDKKLIRDMGIRLKRVQNYSKVSLSSSFKFEVKVVDTLNLWRYKNEWIDFEAKLQNDTLKADMVVYDTIVQVLHRVPKFKFLGICFGTKGVRQEIVSKSPHTKITAAEYIEIVR